ncbi:MAG: AAA family ATPase [Candidatus Pacebacteria bacterium]|nr:AAA family ATPase [Candidatus Paceibacterota bacterium]
MNLFDHAREELTAKEQPLAARMRPRTLEEFVGQDHILAPGRLLRRAIQADQLSSLIFYGPPGTGKTTLASVIAHTTRSHFETLNAVLAGVSDIRRVTKEAKRRRGEHGIRTILFVDEVHRWNKAQQDALLPWVENGTIIMIGATTENPYFTVNRPLVSRSRIFQLKPLEQNDLRWIAHHALADSERGFGNLDVRIEDAALNHIVDVANGDARAVLNALELAVETTTPDDKGRIAITMDVAEESIQTRAVLYDKEGDYHFDTISAFIKSLRGSDPDAAVYWLAKMVYAGEDPRFLFRRMLIFAGEDIGLADPDALVVVTAAAESFDRVGMPEGRYHLGMAALYLATAPKSNSVMAFFDALAAVEKETEDEVPNHLRDASRDKEGFGHGQGYLYPHAYRDHWVAQQYLPKSLRGKIFYQPGNVGYEQSIADTVQRRREAQLAAATAGNTNDAPPEILTYSPPDKDLDRWLARTMSDTSKRLADIRERVFNATTWERHHVVLDLKADDGLFIWEAVRRVPEGGVWGCVSREQTKQALQEQARHIHELRVPHIIVSSAAKVVDTLQGARDASIRFDRIIGRNCCPDKTTQAAVFAQCGQLLREGGLTILAQVIPKYTQRLYKLVNLKDLAKHVTDRVKQAEEALYGERKNALVNWTEHDLATAAQEAGLVVQSCDLMHHSAHQYISDALLERWFPAKPSSNGGTYAGYLAKKLEPEELANVRSLFTRSLRSATVEWNSTTAVITVRKSE